MCTQACTNERENLYKGTTRIIEDYTTLEISDKCFEKIIYNHHSIISYLDRTKSNYLPYMYMKDNDFWS